MLRVNIVDASTTEGLIQLPIQCQTVRLRKMKRHHVQVRRGKLEHNYSLAATL
jgi:hypothetical protein